MMNNLFNLESKIVDVKNKEKIVLYAKIENVNIQKTVSNTDFLNLILIDDSGMINAKKWNIEENEKTLFKIGHLVYVSGSGSEYNGKVQLIIDTIRLVNEFDNVDLSKFYQKAPLSMEVMKSKINDYIGKINNINIKNITEYLFKKYEDKFLVYPAASKNHHAYISGLAHHVCTMLNIAESLSKIYPNINVDLLYSGVILHDIGKVIELSGHLTPEYTTIGKLIGHINIGFEEIRLAANKFNIVGEEVMLLQHLILSHHGLLEYGSPKQPMLLEAELLHMIDMLDSRVNMITDELEQVEENDFTKKIYSLDSRAFYKPKI